MTAINTWRAGPLLAAKLAYSATAANMHWLEGGSVPCRFGCPYCAEDIPIRRYYAPAWMQLLDWDTNKPAWGLGIAELSEKNFSVVEDRPYPLAVWLSRVNRPRSPLVLRIADMQPDKLPAKARAFDVRLSLRRWPGWKNFDLPLAGSDPRRAAQ